MKHTHRRIWLILIEWCACFALCGADGAFSAEKQHFAQATRYAIGLNTVGYLPHASKQATIATTANEFLVRDADRDEIVFRGALTALAGDSANENLRLADFSKFDRAGAYRLIIDDNDTNAEFRIANDIYNWPFYCAVRGMYLWRCGAEVTCDVGDNHFHHAACHLEDAYLDHVGGPADKRTDCAGGWHDAGDYNKYTVNGAFTAGTMLKAWEHFPDKLARLNFNVPESGNDVPDFLDEIRWELDWLLKMQAADGRVYHKVSTLKFGKFIPPTDETARRYFSPWSSAATADFAAVMAQASRIFKPIDDKFAAQCLAAAEKSYAFLQQNPDDHHPDLSAFTTGPYDTRDSDDRLWAAAELWDATGDDRYLKDFEQRVTMASTSRRRTTSTVDVDWDWSDVRNLGTFTYLLSQRPGRSEAILERVRNDALAAADAICKSADSQSYRRPLGSAYYWGSNGTVARQAMNLEVARRLKPDDRYQATRLDALNYLFGRNPFGRSYMTGVGAHPPLFPHDRRSGGDKIAAPWPGYLVGGPWPKEIDWHDDQEDYRTNEVAINWNGALIYALAAFVEPEEFDASILDAKRLSLAAAPAK